MWKAFLSDGKTISGTSVVNNIKVTHLFREVLDNLKLLDSLSIIQDDTIFTISMVDTKVTVSKNGINQSFYILDRDSILNGTLENIRPIYFIRERVDLQIGANLTFGKTTLPKLEFTALGFQASINNKNIKRYLAISPTGVFTIECV